MTALIALDNGRVVEVTSHKWEKISYDIEWVERPKCDKNGDLVRDEKGDIEIVCERDTVIKVDGMQENIPLIPGWAITIHRSQGMSLSNVHIDTKGIFASGQAYVAMSRATSLAGLTMENAMTQSAVRLDPAVREYMEKLAVPRPLIIAREVLQTEMDFDF